MNSKKGLRVGYPAQLILIASRTPYMDIVQCHVKKKKKNRKIKKEKRLIRFWYDFTYTTTQLLHNVDILKYGRF